MNAVQNAVQGPVTNAAPRTLSVSVRHRYGGSGGFSAGVEFEAGPGITALFGRSGAGKSTVLAAIAGLIRPDSGRIALGGDIWFDSASGFELPVHRRGAALVFQSLALFPHLTALDNVRYGIPRSLPDPERRGRALAMLERMRVGHLAGRKPPSFSGGEGQRVALARAFAMEPRLVLLDEPFSALDRDLRLRLAADLYSYVEETGVPLIHVTHNRSEARALAGRIILIEDGRITAAGNTDDLLPDDGMDERAALSALRKR